MPETKRIPVEEIVSLPEVQIRVKISQKKMLEYSEMIGEGIKFDPIDLVIDAENRYLLADGQHRLLAYKERGLKTIEATIHECSPAEAVTCALEIACDRQNKRGMPLSRADKRNAVVKLVMDRLINKKGDKPIAAMIGVSPQLVKEVRLEVYAPKEDVDKVNKDKAKKKSKPSEKEDHSESPDFDLEAEAIKTFNKWVQDELIGWTTVATAFTTRTHRPIMIPNEPTKIRVISGEKKIGFLVEKISVERKQDGTQYILMVAEDTKPEE